MKLQKLFSIFVLLASVLGCWSVAPNRDNPSDKESNVENLKKDLEKQGYSSDQAEQVSRDYQLKNVPEQLGVDSQLRRQRCKSSGVLVDNKSVTVPQCELKYWNRVTLNLNCRMKPLFGNDVNRRPLRFKNVRWQMEGRKGEASTDAKGMFSFSYEATRVKDVIGEPSKTDTDLPASLELSGDDFDVKIALKTSDFQVDLPESVCGKLKK